ncbi:MAG: hypothetical protein IT458_15715, partial [Planctomycetes bacterium]|nr:hypothetical protein [Planctomycetota bacterium]
MTRAPDWDVSNLAAEVRARAVETDPMAVVVANLERLELTDSGNASRLVALAGDDLRYCGPLGGWLAWNGTRWVRGDDAAARYAGDVWRTVLEEAKAAPTGKAAQRYMDHARYSRSAKAIRETLNVAKNDARVVVEPSRFNADPWLLNTPSGIVDLRTGELAPHRRDAYMTKIAAAAFDPACATSEWEEFIRQATGGDDDFARTLWKAAGYSLTGLTTEEVLFIVHGPGGTMKTTFAESLKSAAGVDDGYCETADFEAFLERRDSGGVRNDLAKLAGARIVFAAEVDEGKRLAAGLLKSLTGADRMTVRFLYREAFTYRPQFAIWLLCNHLPHASDGDDALRRRFRVLPFTCKPERPDPAVKLRWTDPAVGGPQVLAWAIRGCLAWQREGLGTPTKIQVATGAYWENQNPLKDFEADRLTFGPGLWVTVASLRATYEAWGEAIGLKHLLGPRAFAERMTMHGCTKGRRKVAGETTRTWEGV